jgi:hypothetical protein
LSVTAKLRTLLAVPELDDPGIGTTGNDQGRCDAKVLELVSLSSIRPDQSDQRAAICFACKGRQLWRSIHGPVVCGDCHPPAVEQLVAEWIDAQGAP